MKRFHILILLVLYLIFTCLVSGCENTEYRDKEISLVIKAGQVEYIKIEKIKSVHVRMSKADPGFVEVNLVCREKIK